MTAVSLEPKGAARRGRRGVSLEANWQPGGNREVREESSDGGDRVSNSELSLSRMLQPRSLSSFAS